MMLRRATALLHSLCKHVGLLQAVTKWINLPGNTRTATLSKIIIKKSSSNYSYSNETVRSRGNGSYFNPKAMLSMMAV